MSLFAKLKQNLPVTAPVAVVTATGRSSSTDVACTSLTVIEQHDAALVRTVREITGVELAGLSNPAMALEPQRQPERGSLTTLENKKLEEKAGFLGAIWSHWKGSGMRFEDAVVAVATDNHEAWPSLAHGGHGGGTLLTVHNAQRWFGKLGKRPNGEPRWDNLPALADAYAKGRRVIDINPDFLRRFNALYLSPGVRTNYGCWRVVKNEFDTDGMGDLVPPFHQIEYYVSTRMSEQVKLRARSPRDYKAMIRGFCSRHRNFGPGDVWFADHRLCDFWVRHPHPQTGEMIAIRPYVTAVMDAFTGRILAWVLYADQAPNWRRIAEAFALSLHHAGNRPPRIWYTDNGKDFLKLGWGQPVRLLTRQGELLHHNGQPYDHSVCGEMGTIHYLARGYNGQEKPIERLLRDQAVDFDRMQPGYCGNCPATRPDYGDTWQGDINKLPALGQVLDELAAWVDAHNAERRGDKPSANDLWAAATWTRPALSDERLTLALLLPSRTALEVGRTGYGLGGIHFAGAMYSHAALREWDGGKGLWGEHVMIKTHWGLPDIVSPEGKRHPPAVFVFHPSGRFICVAMAEVQVAEIAQTAEEKALLGEVIRVIHHAAKLDAIELEQHTGSRRVTQTRPRLLAMPGNAGTGNSSVALGSAGLGTRRLPTAEATPPEADRQRPAALSADAAHDVAALASLLASDGQDFETPPAITEQVADAKKDDMKLLKQLTEDDQW